MWRNWPKLNLNLVGFRKSGVLAKIGTATDASKRVGETGAVVFLGLILAQPWFALVVSCPESALF